MTQIVITSSAADKVSYGDLDERPDPNGGTDTGGEFSSGLWEDLAEIASDLDIKNEAESWAQDNGQPLIVGWLRLARESAVAKDAAALAGDTHPQIVISDPRNPTPTPVVPTATPTPTPTLAPASTPIYDSIIAAADAEQSLGFVAKDLGDILDSISFEEPTFVSDAVKIDLYDAFTIQYTTSRWISPSTNRCSSVGRMMGCGWWRARTRYCRCRRARCMCWLRS